MANVFDLIGRILISALFLISAFNKIFNLEGSMNWMEGFGVPGFLIFPAIVIEIILLIEKNILKIFLDFFGNIKLGK